MLEINKRVYNEAVMQRPQRKYTIKPETTLKVSKRHITTHLILVTSHSNFMGGVRWFAVPLLISLVSFNFK